MPTCWSSKALVGQVISTNCERVGWRTGDSRQYFSVGRIPARQWPPGSSDPQARSTPFRSHSSDINKVSRSSTVTLPVSMVGRTKKFDSVKWEEFNFGGVGAVNFIRRKRPYRCIGRRCDHGSAAAWARSVPGRPAGGRTDRYAGSARFPPRWHAPRGWVTR